MLYITRRDTFAASHRLHNADLSAEENAQLYGKCNWENGHGHNYVLEVTVRGVPSPRTGMVCNLKTLKQVMRDRVVNKVDHRHLNYDVEFLRGINPTSENVAVAIWEQLAAHIPDGHLYRVRLFETENNIVEYYGPASCA
jgi:6-pyruvoyltetrahydropterin/6-carboxytetrahydropterin synthase